MNRKNTLRKVEQAVWGLPEPTPLPEPVEEAAQLAREVARAFDDAMKRFTAKKDDDPRLAPSEWEVRSIRDRPPENVTFGDLNRLRNIDPALATAKWHELQEQARRDLDTGWAAARELEFLGGSAWERSLFMAVRERLGRAWKPRHAAEDMLIDQMAQYEMMRQSWVRLLAFLSRAPQTMLDLQRDRGAGEKAWDKGHAAAAVEAARMIERLQRLYQGAVRTLLSLRRQPATCTVRATGTVNVGLGAQLNVAGQSRPGAPGYGEAGANGVADV